MPELIKLVVAETVTTEDSNFLLHGGRDLPGERVTSAWKKFGLWNFWLSLCHDWLSQQLQSSCCKFVLWTFFLSCVFCQIYSKSTHFGHFTHFTLCTFISLQYFFYWCYSDIRCFLLSASKYTNIMAAQWSASAESVEQEWRCWEDCETCCK